MKDYKKFKGNCFSRNRKESRLNPCAYGLVRAISPTIKRFVYNPIQRDNYDCC